MKLLNTALDEKKFDVRMIDRNLRRNFIQYEEVKKHFQALPDDEECADFTGLEASNSSGSNNHA